MVYDVLYHKEARAALDRMSPEVARRILRKIEHLRNDLAGDVKRLTAFMPHYRLRVGDWRVLFDVSGNDINRSLHQTPVGGIRRVRKASHAEDEI